MVFHFHVQKMVQPYQFDPCAPYCPDSWEALGGRSLEAMDAVETFAAVHDGCLLSSSDEMTIAFHFPVLKDSEKKFVNIIIKIIIIKINNFFTFLF